MLSLEAERGNGRDDYPVRPMWNSLIAAFVFQHASIAALRRDVNRIRLPDMVRWPQLPESNSSRFSGFFWVNMRLSRFIATFSADKGHDT